MTHPEPLAGGEEHEALLQFLYLAPVGLIQASLDGTVAMINPVSAQLLMPLSADGSLDNLFTALEAVAPELRGLCAQFAPRQGVICDGKHLRVGRRGTRGGAAMVLSLSLVKLGDTRLMAVLTDITEQVQRERERRQTDAWLNAIMTGIADYALVRLDHAGRVEAWNPSIGRVTGFGADAVTGQSYGMFQPPGAATDEQLADRLAEAGRNGWSLDEGLRQRADGSGYWASTMLSPLRGLGEDSPPSYCLIMRDISDKPRAGGRDGADSSPSERSSDQQNTAGHER